MRTGLAVRELPFRNVRSSMTSISRAITSAGLAGAPRPPARLPFRYAPAWGKQADERTETGALVNANRKLVRTAALSVGFERREAGMHTTTARIQS